MTAYAQRVKKGLERKEDINKEGTSGPSAVERVERLKENVEKIIDEIDEILEENAEDFVKNFIQRSGE